MFINAVERGEAVIRSCQTVLQLDAAWKYCTLLASRCDPEDKARALDLFAAARDRKEKQLSSLVVRLLELLSNDAA
jgi:hypothetical protein